MTYCLKHYAAKQVVSQLLPGIGKDYTLPPLNEECTEWILDYVTLMRNDLVELLEMFPLKTWCW